MTFGDVVRLDTTMISLKSQHQIFFIFNHLISWMVYANCYFPDGTDSNIFYRSNVNQPCNNDDEFGMCCATNRVYPDVC